MHLEKIIEKYKSGNFNSIIIYGATASGKSDLGIKIAERLNKAIIINADSMQVYKEIPIITAQPSSLDGHFLYSIISCNDVNFSVAGWLKIASEEINKAIHDNITPIVLGGTGMYISSLIDGLTAIPEISPEIMNRVIDDLKRIGLEAMHKRLFAVDQKTAEKVCDPQRITRALAVFTQTGKAISEWQQSNEKYFDSNRTMKIWLKPERQILYKRINDRFIRMLEVGAIDEVQKLLRDFPNISYPKAIGIEQIKQYLNGDTSKESLISIGQQLTRNYAKRQETWFRNRFRESDRFIIESI